LGAAPVAVDLWSGVDIDDKVVRLDWPMPIEDARMLTAKRHGRFAAKSKEQLAWITGRRCAGSSSCR
jgi:hypothetical protein